MAIQLYDIFNRPHVTSVINSANASVTLVTVQDARAFGQLQAQVSWVGLISWLTGGDRA